MEPKLMTPAALILAIVSFACGWMGTPDGRELVKIRATGIAVEMSPSRSAVGLSPSEWRGSFTDLGWQYRVKLLRKREGANPIQDGWTLKWRCHLCPHLIYPVLCLWDSIRPGGGGYCSIARTQIVSTRLRD